MNIHLGMDPNILLSVLNTKLRNDYDTLKTMCADLGLDPEAVKEKMAQHGYTFNTESKQFILK